MAKLNLKLTLNKDGSVTANWSQVSGVARYHAYMYPVGKDYCIYNETKLTATSYRSRAGLEANKQYCVVVVAYNSSSVAVDSEAVKILIKSDFYKISVPQNVKATATPSTVKVSFDKVSSATSYDILFDGSEYSVTTTSKTFSGLKQRTKHTYAVRAKNAYKTSAYSTTQTITTPAQTPSVPSGISKSSTESTVTLTWKASIAATGYEVVFDGTTYEVTETSKVFTGLSANKKYTFKIRAMNEDVASKYCTAQSVRTTPKAPEITKVIVNENSIKISWGAVSGATSYDILFNGKVYNVTGTSKKFTGLSDNTSYTYQICVRNANGASTYSAARTVKTTPLPPSEASVETSQDSVTLSWDAVPGATSYDVVFNGKTYHVIGTTLTISGLTPGKKYTYKIRINNDDGSSSYGATKSVTTLPKPPEVPTNVSAAAAAKAVTVKWKAAARATNYDVLFGNKVYNVTTTSKKITGLKSGRTYSYRVRANNAGGSSEYSAVKTVTTLIPKPEVPTNVSATAKSCSVTVNWSAVEDATSYDVWFNGTVYNVTGTSKTIEGLTPSTSYSYKVRAKNSTGNSAYSTVQKIKTLEKLPDVPSDIEASATMNSIVVSWANVEDATDYDVEFDGISYNVTSSGEITFIGEDEQEEADVVEVNGYEPFYPVPEIPTKEGRIYKIFAGLAADTKHFYRVRANNANGSSPYSDIESIHTEFEIDNGMEGGTSKSTYPNGKTFYTGADPVNALTGAFLWSYTWLEDYGKDNLAFTTMYDSQRDDSAKVLGKKWTYSLNYLLSMDEKNAYFCMPSGGVRTFRIDKEYGPFPSASGGYPSYSMKKNEDGSYSVCEHGGREFIFDSNCCLNRIVKNTLVEYWFTADLEGRIVRIEGRHGASLNLTYAGARIISVEDAMGNKVAFTYKKKCLGAVVNAEGKAMTFTYDKAFNLLTISDFLGNVYLKNKYDAYGRVTKQQAAGRGDSLVAYDKKNRVTTFTDEVGNDTRYTYDENGHMVKVELAGNCIENSYNGYGQMTKRVDAHGNITQMEYDECGRMTRVVYPDGMEEQAFYSNKNLPTKVINRDGTVKIYYYDINNNPSMVVDENGDNFICAYDDNDNLRYYCDKEHNEWKYTYDENNHLKEATDPEGNVYQYSYDIIGRLTSYTSPEGRTTLYQYSAAGDLVSIEDADGAILFEYNENGSRTGITDKMGNKQRLEYNDMGQVVLVTDFQGNEYHFEYNAKGELVCETDPLGYNTFYAYDAVGNRTEWVDKNGNITRFSFDAANQLTEVKNAVGGTVNYVYDIMGRVKAIIDPLEHQTAYEYDSVGRVTSVTNALGHSVHYTYDKVGNLLTKTDEDGVVTAYEYDKESRLISINSDAGTIRFVYDSLGRVVIVEDTDEQVEAAAYDGDGNLTIALDKENNRTTYTYDLAGRLVEEIAPNGGKKSYAYDKNGNCTKVIDAEGHEYSYEYDENNRLVKATNPLNQAICYSYDSTGKLVSIMDAKGGTITFSYDGNGNLIQETNALGGVKVYTYDELNRLVETVDEEGHKRIFDYDMAGNMISYTDANENQWNCTYDALNRVTSVTGQDDGKLILDYTKTGKIAKVTDQEGAETSYLYDSMGRMTKMSDALGHSLSFTYDSKGRILSQTDANGNTTEYSYSPAGNLLSVKDPEGNTTTYTYNALGQMLTATDPLGNTVSYEYDILGQVASITDTEGGKTTFTYTANGQIETVTDAGGALSKYSYDACGNLVQIIDPLGNVVAYEYDAMNNQIQECLSTSEAQTCVTVYQYDMRGCRIREINPLSEQKTHIYDGNGNIIVRLDEENNESSVRYDLNNRPVQIQYDDGKEVAFRYNKRGELVEMIDWNGMVTMERDKLGRITKVTDPDGYTTGYSYDGVGNRIGIQYPDGSKVSYAYDKNNRLTKVTDGDGQTTQYTYDAAGNMLSMMQPGGIASYSYNARRQPIEADYRFDDGTMMIESLAYDPLGRVTASERKGSTEELTRSAAYGYDALGQLVSCKEGQNTETYMYDAVGNRISKAVNGIQKSTYKYNQMNQLISMMEDGIQYNFVYDRRGNLTEERKGVDLLRSYTYDATNRMVFGENLESGETTEYGYNGLMMRVKNVQTLLEEDIFRIKEKRYVADYLSRDRNDLMSYEEGVGVTRNVYGRGYEGLSSKLTPELPTVTGKKNYFQSDLYGSPLFAADEQGKVQRYAGRNIWGDVSGAEADDLKFTTYSYDCVIDKYFAQARFYDSRQGRLLAKDPVKRGLNAYPYCDNDPVNYVDPSGKFLVSHALKSIGAGVFDGLCDFGQSLWNQYQNGEDIDLLEAAGCGLKGFAQGTAEEFLLGSKTKRWVTAVVDFGAGTIGSLAEQIISGDGIDIGDALYDGVMNTVEGLVFGKQSVKGLGDAIKRGAKAGAATSIVDNIHNAVTGGSGTGAGAGFGMLGLGINSGLSQMQSRDPKTACGSTNPFSSGINFNGSTGYQNWIANGSGNRTGNGFSLVATLGDIVNDTIWGGVGSAAQYGGGKLVEGLENFVSKRWNKSGSKTHVPSNNTQIVHHPEIKSPNQVKMRDVTNYWDDYLGSNQTNIHPRTGLVDNDRIFSADGTRSIRFGNHEMNSMGTTKFHFHQEEWKYDSVNDVMEYFNTLVRIKK